MQARITEAATAARIADARRRDHAEDILCIDIEIAQRHVAIEVLRAHHHRCARTQANHEVDGRDVGVTVAWCE